MGLNVDNISQKFFSDHVVLTSEMTRSPLSIRHPLASNKRDFLGFSVYFAKEVRRVFHMALDQNWTEVSILTRKIVW